MIKTMIRVFILFAAVILSGCSITQIRSVDQTSADPKADAVPLHKLYQIWAMRYAINQEFQKALYYWEIAGKLDPEDRKIPIRADGLRAFLENESERHYIRGMKACQDNLINKAKIEFLTALRYNPQNQKVLRNLKNMTTQCEFSGYTVQEGDTFRQIADRVYQDPDLDFLVAYLLGMSLKDNPVPGEILNLPTIAHELAEAPKERISIVRKKEIQKSKLSKKNDKSAPIHRRRPRDEEAGMKPSNDALYQKGIILYEQKKYLDSLTVFTRIDPSYKDVHELISMINAELVKEAEEHYHKGVRLFIHEKIAEAIKEWEKTLALNPEHDKATKNIQDAKALLEKLEEVE